MYVCACVCVCVCVCLCVCELLSGMLAGDSSWHISAGIGWWVKKHATSLFLVKRIYHVKNTVSNIYKHTSGERKTVLKRELLSEGRVHSTDSCNNIFRGTLKFN